MNVLVGFTPFIAFFVLLKLVSPLAGLVSAMVVSVLLCVRTRARHESLKILELGSVVVFVALVLYTLVAAPVWTVATVRLAADSGLLAIVLFSLAIGRPFTLQYARERVPEQYWSSPLFLTTSRRIAIVWAGSFAVHAAADAAAQYLPAIPLFIDIAASLGTLAAALWFTFWYPAVARRAAAAAAVPPG